MPKQETAKIIPFKAKDNPLGLVNRSIVSKESKILDFKKAANKLLKKQWEEEWNDFSRRPESDLINQGLIPLGDLFRRRVSDGFTGAVIGNLESVSRAGDLQKIQRSVRKAESVELKAGVRLIYSSKAIEDPMIYRRDRGFWMRRTVFELFEI